MGGLDGPPKPPGTLGSAPAKPWRSSNPRTLGSAPAVGVNVGKRLLDSASADSRPPLADVA
jgi:hypothetical protein